MTKLVVDYMSLTGAADGGTPVTSYELQWNQGDHIGTWVELIGGSSDSLATQYTVYDAGNPTLVESGKSYSFKYRAKNRQGTGAFSTVTSIIAANRPDQLSPAVTTMNGVNVKISWSITDQPGYSQGGQPITEYSVLILTGDNNTFAGYSSCEPSAATLTNLFCEIPMSDLTNVTGTFRLPLGTLV